MPSKPASKIAANAIYGFAAGSTERTSIRVDNPLEDGTRINGERFYHSMQYNMALHNQVLNVYMSLLTGYIQQ